MLSYRGKIGMQDKNVDEYASIKFFEGIGDGIGGARFQRFKILLARLSRLVRVLL